jgi:predicted  nucleic acid-binding Zn-ribbon protein
MRRQLSEASSEQRRRIVKQRYQNISSLRDVIDSEMDNVVNFNETLHKARQTASSIGDVEDVSATSQDVDALDDAIETVDDEASDLETSLSDLETSVNNYTSANVSSQSSGLSQYSAMTSSSSTADDTLSSVDVSSAIDELQNESEALSYTLSDQSEAVNTANNRLSDVKEDAATIVDTLNRAQESLNGVYGELTLVQSGLTRLANPDVEQVANPLQTSVSRVGESKFSFGKTTPYLVSIETFLFALLLGGAIAFNQNMGSAANRELLAPVGASTRVMAAVATGLAISLIQTLLTAGAAIGHLQLWSVNVPTVLAFLILAGLMSLLLGVILGQIFETMQGLLLGALATGTVFISFSDFVTPLERFHPLAARVGEYNPFTVAVEALRRSMFFDTTMSDLVSEALLLGGFVVGLGLAAVILQYRWKRDSTEQQPSRLVDARMRLSRVSSGQDLVEWLDNVSFRTYRLLRGEVDDTLSGLDLDVSLPWFRKGRLAKAVQSSSSMSSMSSSESKSSSSSSSPSASSSAPSVDSSSDADDSSSSSASSSDSS